MTADRRSPARRQPGRKRASWRRRLVYGVIAAAALSAIAACAVLGYYYVQFSRLIDERMQGARGRSLPRVFARPFELRRGQALTEPELIDRLNDLGYAQRPEPVTPGEFTVEGPVVTLRARGGPVHGRLLRVAFTPPATKPKTPAPARVVGLELEGTGPIADVSVDPPFLSELVGTGREKRRKVPLASIPKVQRDAVLAIEDRRFYDHPGVDVVRTIGAVVTNLRGDRPYLVGGSTLTQQLVKNFFLTREKTIRRKLLEQFMALIMERRLSKEEILELYLNEVYLGQRGSFAIHGVAEAARLYFGKDVANVALPEAAMIAGMIQAPPLYSPFRAPARARERRNVVLGAMAETGVVTADEAARAAATPLTPATRALDAEAPHFVDLVAQAFAEQYPALADGTRPVDVHTTLDLHLQRLGQDALREGLAKADALLARKRRAGRVEGALLAIDPRTGEVLAFVGGRAYGQSQLNRVMVAKRQPGSVFKPFVYLAAFEAAAAEGRTDITPATLVLDEPTTFFYEDKEWTPGNYEDEYDGPITLRRALAMSRNVATARLGELVGFDRVAALWRRVGTSTQPRPFPSIVLGVFEATPFEIAQAYTIFPSGGELRPLRTVLRVTAAGRDVSAPATVQPRRVARPDTTFLVTSMMRSVVNEGTGAGVRGAGFALDAAGKTGTTNDLRDAWFVGFTPELLTVVWVGYDDNQVIGLSGSQVALPIWVAFMQRALAGHPNVPFEPPAEGLMFADIDRDTGKLATPGCLRVLTEVFLAGTEPSEHCEVHRF